ncbi:protein-tyrosine phosphatase family protein [Thiolinea disciformis]|uniref:protein-tyrosine phosphatase family protein n=1 Tax=Thiolinea disciformis TaxID=125614 RepID=UPI000DA1C166
MVIRPTLYTLSFAIKGKLSLMARPLGEEHLEEYIQGLQQLNITTVVSLLESQEQYELGLRQQPVYCANYDLTYIHFPIPDRGLPSTPKALELAKQLWQRIDEGEHVVIHCRAGIGRTGIIAGAVLVASGIKPPQALQLISEARGVKVPDTDEQEAWLLNLPNYLK